MQFFPLWLEKSKVVDLNSKEFPLSNAIDLQLKNKQSPLIIVVSYNYSLQED